jgi:hypothetical protein
MGLSLNVLVLAYGIMKDSGHTPLGLVTCSETFCSLTVYQIVNQSLSVIS